MFEWLEKEAAAIQTHKFHLLNQSGDTGTASYEEDILHILPPSYVEFITKFGRAELYRRGSYYLVIVFDHPKEAVTVDGVRFLKIGFSSYGYACILYPMLDPGEEVPIFEYDPDDEDVSLEKSFECFEDWLIKRCNDARNTFTQQERIQILKGPKPFDDRESAIIRERNKFEWSILGFNENGNVKILVKNKSNITLPYFSIGVKSVNGSLSGRLWLPTHDIAPGQTKEIEHSCYNNLIPRSQVEIYNLPDPEPEDRDQYWEFKSLDSFTH